MHADMHVAEVLLHAANPLGVGHILDQGVSGSVLLELEFLEPPRFAPQYHLWQA